MDEINSETDRQTDRQAEREETGRREGQEGRFPLQRRGEEWEKEQGEIMLVAPLCVCART